MVTEFQFSCKLEFCVHGQMYPGWNIPVLSQRLFKRSMEETTIVLWVDLFGSWEQEVFGVF